MSLVGPRPERPEFVDLFRKDIERYGERHRVCAGINRLGASQRIAREDVDPGQGRVGQLLHREVVHAPGFQDPRAHDPGSLSPRRMSIVDAPDPLATRQSS